MSDAYRKSNSNKLILTVGGPISGTIQSIVPTDGNVRHEGASQGARLGGPTRYIADERRRDASLGFLIHGESSILLGVPPLITGIVL